MQAAESEVIMDIKKCEIHANDVKEYGLSIGYTAIGITSADGFPEYVKEVESRGDSFGILNFTTANPLVDAFPKQKFPEAKSVIVMVWDYYQCEYPESLKQMVGKAYLGRAYNPRPGTIAFARQQLMTEFLEAAGCTVRSDIGLPARWAGAAAGVTQFGKNNFAYCDKAGSYVIISCLVVDREFEYDEPTMECTCPPGCTLCIDACPTGALYEPFHLDPKRCIAYNHWMTREGLAGIDPNIPDDIREAMGCKIHGCDICQDVCPRNRKSLQREKPVDPFVELLGKDIDLPSVLSMTDEFYQARIKPIMYNYIRDIRYFQRNAAIAMGNSGEVKYIPCLEEALESADALLREYIEWALDRLK